MSFSDNGSPRVSLRSIRKTFGSLVANDSVDLDLYDGEVHALLGENGAGKSTLMNVLYGLYTPEAGTISIEGELCEFGSPADAIAAGIGMVHQHFMLVPALTVLENIIIGISGPREPILDFKALRSRIDETLRAYRINVDLDARVSQLSVGVQQRVEIVKALFRGARTIILDEPTAVLTPQEVDEFFGVLDELRSFGHSIVFITHKLREVKAVSDRVTVLRAGRVVGTGATKDYGWDHLAEMMVGRQLSPLKSLPAKEVGEPVLEVETVRCANDRGLEALQGVSLSVCRGEIVGVAGVDGNGQTELAEVIAGLREVASGDIRIRGRDCSGASPKERFQMGIGHIPQDRHKMGMIGEFSVAENLVLQTHSSPHFSRFGTLEFSAIARNARDLIERFSVRTSSPDASMNTLSGGNQQKVIVAREFSREPDLMLAVQPTRGLDVGAAQFVHEQLLEARQGGKGILLISTELDEIMALSDRILVMFEGRIVGEVPSGEVSREKIGLLMAGRLEDATGIASGEDR